MAGKPKRRAMIAELEKRTRQRFDENEEGEHTPLDYVCDYIEDRGTLIGLAVTSVTNLGLLSPRPVSQTIYVLNTLRVSHGCQNHAPARLIYWPKSQ